MGSSHNRALYKCPVTLTLTRAELLCTTEKLMVADDHRCVRLQWALMMMMMMMQCCPGLVISNIDIDVDIIDDTFDVSISISTILSYKSIDRGIDDTFLAFFYRHYIDTSELTCKMTHITF